jgi:hypothetical protein
MIKYENECVGCTTIGLHCIGPSCRNRNVPHFYCDRCKNEAKLFHYDGDELCAKCIIKDISTETDEYEYDESDVAAEYARVEGS